MKGGKKVEEETKKPCTPVEEAGGDYNELGLYLHSKEITKHWKRHRPFGNSCRGGWRPERWPCMTLIITGRFPG